MQLGFIAGTLAFALLAVADRFSPRRVFLACSLAGAALALATALLPPTLAGLVVLRFATGIALAGIYPVGMKIAAGWYAEGLGLALGVLVGALVLGTALPFALRALGAAWPWQAVMTIVAAVAAAGGVLMALAVPDGPYLVRGSGKAALSPRALGVIWIDPSCAPRCSATSATCGSCTPSSCCCRRSWRSASRAPTPRGGCSSRLRPAPSPASAAACSCAASAARASPARSSRAAAPAACSRRGCSMRRSGSGRPGSCSGARTVSGDSPQFSALTASNAPRALVGSVLTLVNSIGFAISVLTITLFASLAAARPLAHVLPWLALGPAVGVLLPAPAAAPGAAGPLDEGEPMTIATTRLGRTGLVVSRLALGTMTFGLQTDEAVSQRILDTASDGGVNFIDTADVYPLGGTIETAGRTEEIIGRWLRAGGPGRRAAVVLATKAVGRIGPNPWDQGASRKHLLDAIDASLRRLQTDHVDLYQLHHDDRETPLDESLEALDAIVRSGRARYVGVSNFMAWRLARALGRSELRNLVRFVSVQPRYSLLFREIERELLPLAGEEGLAVIPYNPLAGGLLSGKHDPTARPAADSRFTLGSAGAMYQERYWNERNFATVERLAALAGEAGLPLATLAVAWVLANPLITAPILGASRPEQLGATLAAADVRLDAGLKQRLDELTAEYRKGDAPR